jgi:hypothetical protein
MKNQRFYTTMAGSDPNKSRSDLAIGRIRGQASASRRRGLPDTIVSVCDFRTSKSIIVKVARHAGSRPFRNPRLRQTLALANGRRNRHPHRPPQTPAHAISPRSKAGARKSPGVRERRRARFRCSERNAPYCSIGITNSTSSDLTTRTLEPSGRGSSSTDRPLPR